MNNEYKGLLFFIILIMGLSWFAFDMDSRIPFTDTADCKKYWLVHTNVTAGQGERYDVTNNICTLSFLGTYGYGDASVSMNKVDEFVNVATGEGDLK